MLTAADKKKGKKKKRDFNLVDPSLKTSSNSGFGDVTG
jgi:hypothetical protein